MFTDFRHKLQKLTYLEYQGPRPDFAIDLSMTDDELLAEFSKAPVTERFLHHYTEEDIRAILERHGVIAALLELGYDDIKIEIGTREVYNHRLWVYTGVKDYDHILIELRLRDGYFRPKQQFVPGFELTPMSMILVDWFMLQNPKVQPAPNRPLLPEQRHPGLGLLNCFVAMVQDAVAATGAKAVLDVPEHFHGALFYSKWFSFLNPAMEGSFRAMRRDLMTNPLHIIGRAFDLNAVYNTKQDRFEKWVPGEQIMPTHPDLIAYFQLPGYLELRDRALAENAYRIDLDKYRQREQENAERKAGGEVGGQAAPKL